jgi:hypothetical protein
VIHVKSGEPVDLHARARPIEEPDERRKVFERLLDSTRYELDAWIARSPLAELEF